MILSPELTLVDSSFNFKSILPILSENDPVIWFLLENNAKFDIAEFVNQVSRAVSQTAEKFTIHSLGNVKAVDNETYILVNWDGWPEIFSTYENLASLNLSVNNIELLKAQPKPSNKSLDEQIEASIRRIRIFCMKHKISAKLFVSNYLKHYPSSKKCNMINVPRKKRSIALPATWLSNKSQLKIKLDEFQALLAKCYPNEAPITVENKVDYEIPPSDLTYIKDYYYSDGVIISDIQPFGCVCCSEEPNEDSKKTYLHPCWKNRKNCCGKLQGGEYAYDPHGYLHKANQNIVIECNSRCSCSSSCPFRVIQKGRKLPLCIFRTGNGRGWGIKTMRSIKSNRFITEYLGEVITHEEAERRGLFYDQQMLTYLFDLDISGEPEYVVDASRLCNISHFFNHSCDPNMEVRAVMIDSFDIRLHRLAFFAKRYIPIGEELTFDYKMDLSADAKACNPSPPEASGSTTLEYDSQSGTEVDAQSLTISLPDSASGTSSSKRMRCLCGASKCRKFLVL